MAESQKIEVPLKCPYYTINTLFLIASLVTLTMSLALKYEFSIVGGYLNAYSEKAILFLLAGSIVIIADACLGLIVLSRRWYRGIMTFIFCTVYLFITMIILVTLTYVFSITAENMMYQRLKEDISNPDQHINAINTLQTQLHCCGYNNYSDWIHNTNSIPQSCCRMGPMCDTENSSELYLTGCRYALESMLNCRKWIITAVLGVLGFIEFVSIVLSIEVCRDLKRSMTVGPLTTVGNTGSNLSSNPIPRIKNPLGHRSLPSVGNVEPYVRRPSQLPVTLNYRSPHESFLRQPPQLRFDRRIILSSGKHINPHAGHPGINS